MKNNKSNLLIILIIIHHYYYLIFSPPITQGAGSSAAGRGDRNLYRVGAVMGGRLRGAPRGPVAAARRAVANQWRAAQQLHSGWCSYLFFDFI